jgi:ribosomal protein S16
MRRRTYEMYVYIKSEPQLWTVGFYTPSGEWVSESDYECREDAAERVHWLNGGGKPSDTIKDFILDLSRMSGTGNGIGASTIAKLKAFAKEYGYC